MSFGEQIKGYNERVLNEREARAAAGILLVFGMISFLNSFMLGSFIFTKYFISFFMIDFAIRMINPRYSPSLLMGRIFIQNQTPEYVGASQKRFAWSIGFVLSMIMFYLLVLNPTMTPIKIIICSICLMLLFFESAFSICLGCKIYNILNTNKSTNCPGGACEVKIKEDIVKFNIFQKIIVILLTIFTIIGLYLFITKTPNKSVALKNLPMMLMTYEEREKMREERYNQMMESQFDDDDDDE
jgi:branched-subunit amino acid ABC-type transport system permease component